jgi:hypothetical protein
MSKTEQAQAALDQISLRYLASLIYSDLYGEPEALQELLKPVREYLKIVRASRHRPDRQVNREGIVASRETALLPAVLRQIAERRLHRVWVLDDEERGVKVLFRHLINIKGCISLTDILSVVSQGAVMK